MTLRTWLRRGTLPALSLLLAGLGAPTQADSIPRGTLPEAFVSQMQWRSIGPSTMGGRTLRITVYPQNPDIYWIGTASGGLWKTTDGGVHFEPQFQFESVNSIGDVAVAANNPNILYLGTGENNPRNSVTWGDGVYKSTDGGKTWRNIGLRETRHIGRILIHPQNPDIVYVGAMGRVWGRNEERGLYKTTNGGRTWEKILYVDDQTGVIDMQMHPRDPDTLLVATWQRQREIYDVGEPDISHGPGSGVYKTTDGGKTFRKISGGNGLPEGEMGRTGINYFQSDPNIVFLITGGARIRDGSNGVYRSDDGGETWRKVNDIAPRPMYYSKIRVDPNDSNYVYVLGVQLARSEDGGETFRNLPLRGVHVDHHDLWVDPRDSNRVLLGNDGGFYESNDRAATFRHLRKFALGQYYHVAVDHRRDYAVGGGLQDNGTYYGQHMRRGGPGPLARDFRSIGGGDGFVVRFDPRDHRLVYLESQNGNIRRVFLGPREEAPPGVVRRPPGQQNWAWKTDFILDPNNPDIYYTAGEYVYRSLDRGVDLQRISPRIPITRRGSSTAINVSPLDSKVIYVGADDGGLWVTRDGGENWTPIHDNLPTDVRSYISTIETSRFAAGRCYVAMDAHRSDDERPYLFVTEDFGATWRSINANLPTNASTRCLREDPTNPNLLYVGTEFHAFVSVNRGQHWVKMNNNLPTVAIHDFAISEAAGELIAGTHGRSLWVLDITWLRQFDPDTMLRPVHLFRPHSAVLWDHRVDETPQVGPGDFVGENPPDGALLYYHLDRAARSAEILVKDNSGRTLRTMAVDRGAGLHRVLWDLRADGATERVGPGVYQVTVRVRFDRSTVERTTGLVVEPDPGPNG